MRRLLGSVVLSAVATTAAPAPAQVVRLSGVAEAPPPTTGPKSLSSRIGIGAAERLLTSGDPEARLRGIERLGSLGSPRALERLGRALESGGEAGTPRARLVAARALAPHARRTEVRQTLVRLLSGSGTAAPSSGLDPLEALARGTAAFALARSGESEAIDALGKALRQEGARAEVAAGALIAHPPANLGPVVSARGAPTLTLIDALARLGDQRAFHALRAFVRRGTGPVRGQAAVALTRLGDLETVELARYWLDKESDDDDLRRAATEILAMARAGDAPKAIASALRDRRPWALAVALQSPHADLIEPLSAYEDDARSWAAIARIGGSAAAGSLKKGLSGKRSSEAAYALAICRGGAATRALADALGKPGTRRVAVRAAAVRFRTLGVDVPGARETATALASSDDPADRAAGVGALVTLSPADAARWLNDDAHVVAAAAASAALGNAGVAQSAARRLAKETDPLLRSALSVSLVHPAAAARVPTSVLIELVEGGGAAAALAALALASRDDDSLRPRLRDLLTTGDPLVRAQTAFGLARSERGSVLGLLEQAYRFETQPRVRLALVTALSQRKEASRLRVLRLAADLDPSGPVRQAARIAIRGRRLTTLPAGSGALWVHLSRTVNAGPAPAAVVELPTGLAIPAVADPDGLVVLTGLPAGPVAVRVALTPDPGQVGDTSQRAEGN